jgi:hypothetical protein
MNSTPAASSARRRAWLFAAVREVLFSVSSARRIVVTPTAECRARSSALHRTSARPALSCALVRGVTIWVLTGSFRMVWFIPYEAKRELPEPANSILSHGGRYEAVGVENGSDEPPLFHRRVRRPGHHGQ